MYKFLIVYEKTENGYSAYSPGLEGCVATGSTKKQAEKNMYEALESHIKGMVEDKIPIPKTNASVEYVLFDKRTLASS
ncbi:MAG: type II toxin-antitoxin system HicB family antitoxin [Candidatus Altiarchaeota archaeon]